MRTERITVFPDVANLPLRPPAMLAKAAATLDILSGGRLELGLGAGGFWEAIAAYDGPVRTPGESVSAIEEAIQVIRLLWSGQHGIRFDGQFYHLAGAHSGPAPARPVRAPATAHAAAPSQITRARSATSRIALLISSSETTIDPDPRERSGHIVSRTDLTPAPSTNECFHAANVTA